ncbi:hypothetical protein HETIRDRAFT_108693 [Heterobasidion irregulare TC 32-1]|uniref:Uncharacterized protein n=1 Tax=Heterobasidion irregulare (strain TC 32-1) TaxID=747525 RepID=W4KBF6_HETIT|nr:uncharacterized protein HETIRDRAFT_108693 [Heterobasidion irregulare TC 32-1]ETW82386.1 hypothetical protein HETIRDRAFT_108693 [Heterobasidion irregulare TC 32-1]
MGFISFVHSIFSSPSLFRFSFRWAMSNPEDGVYFPNDSSVCKLSMLHWAALIVSHSSRYHRPRITRIQHCKWEDRVMHEFLIIDFTYPTSPTTKRTVPVIVEHTMEIRQFRPDMIQPGLAEILSRASVRSSRASLSCASISSSSSLSISMPAVDYITTPLSGAPIRSINEKTTRLYVVCRTLTFPMDTTPTDYDLAALLRALHEYSPNYDLISRQYYWFAATIYDVFCAVPGATSVDHDVPHFRDIRRRFLTIFTIQPEDPPLDNILLHYIRHLKDFESTAWRSMQAANATISMLKDELALAQQQLVTQGYAGPSNRT